MNGKSKKILDIYQCEYNRNKEEDFSAMLAEKDDLRLFFVNENQVFTDGRNIVVDPANDELFCDKKALINTEQYLGLPPSVSNDEYTALQMITRCENIHETLHIIYSEFPPRCISDVRGSNKLKKTVLASISNIIEDAFIEAAGASEFDKMDLFLKFGRVSRLYSNTPAEGTIQRNFEKFSPKSTEPIMEFLDYFVTKLLYPMVKLAEVSCELVPYIEKTEKLFEAGSVCGDPKERYTYTQKIFDEIVGIIPEYENDEQISKICEMMDCLLGGSKTHGTENASIAQYVSKGKIAVITKRLFDGADILAEYGKVMEEFAANKEFVMLMSSAEDAVWEYTGSGLKAGAIHKNIKLKVTRPKPNMNMKKAYQNIYNKYKLNINSFNTRFRQLLKGMSETREDKYAFGSGIASKMLGDPKKRYWYRNVRGVDVPDVAILFLIDGSGSMEGELCDGALVASVILHEVLAKNNIEHAIVEHRAIFGEPLVEHNILIDFNFKANDKYNIMRLDADNGTREGLSLVWAEKYLRENSSAENKVIIVISDGVPYHTDGEEEYAPPVSTKDTKNAADKIYKSGVEIIAVALESGGESYCYDDLSGIYRRVVRCGDIKRLTGQLLTLVSKLFS